MTGVKPAPTPLVPSPTLTIHFGNPLSDPSEFRTIVGSLRYQHSIFKLQTKVQNRADEERREGRDEGGSTTAVAGAMEVGAVEATGKAKREESNR